MATVLSSTTKDAFCVKSLCVAYIYAGLQGITIRLSVSFFAASHKTKSSRSELCNVRSVERNNPKIRFSATMQSSVTEQ
jgi:hypothetical protein